MLNNLRPQRERKVHNARGQAMLDYALVLSLVVVVLIASMKLLGLGISTKVQAVASALDGTTPAGSPPPPPPRL